MTAASPPDPKHPVKEARLGVYLPKCLLESFDEILAARRYSSRSEGIRDALRIYLAGFEGIPEKDAECQGVLILVYDKDHRGLLTTVPDIRHEFWQIVKTTLHSRITADRCLEVLLLKGPGLHIRTLIGRLQSQKGVVSVKFTLTATE